MKVREAVPLLERTLEALKGMPEDIDIISVSSTFLASEQFSSIHVTEAADMVRLATHYGRSSVRSYGEEPDGCGNTWAWLRFCSPDNFLRFLQCERKTAPSDTTTGDGTA